MQEVQYRALTNQLYKLATLKSFKKYSNTELALIKCHTVYFKAQKGSHTALASLIGWHTKLSELKAMMQEMINGIEKELSTVGKVNSIPLGREPVVFSINCKLAGDYVQLLIFFDELINKINAMYVLGKFTKAQYFDKTNSITKMVNRLTTAICLSKLDEGEEKQNVSSDELKKILESEYLPIISKATMKGLKASIAGN